jgi:RNA polymerase-binding transcription factor DksA
MSSPDNIRNRQSVRTLNVVNHAIGVLDGGEYGTCEDSSEAVSLGRVTAIPWSRVCMKCREARDRRDLEPAFYGLSVAA